jgi:hypothetical protein
MIFALILFFTGNLTDVFAKDLKLLDAQEYLIDLPQEIIYEYLTNDEDLYFATSNKPSFNLQKNEFYIKILNNPTLPCIPEKLNPGLVLHNIEPRRTDFTLETHNLDINEGKAYWSYVDHIGAYDSVIFLDNPVFCTASSNTCKSFDITMGSCIPPEAMYAFCAEKEGKRVAICIQQQTKNEAQAKQIFESFRWLDNEEASSSTQSTEFSSSTITVSSVSSESSLSSVSSSSSSEIAIEPTPITPQPWYVRFWQWVLSWL